ncbi:MAG: signal peptidase I [Ruminococcus sp.]|nr:signal peptidase I [Ruminococcus sp.]
MDTENDGDTVLPDAEQVRAERDKLSYRAKYMRIIRSTVAVLIVVAAVAVLVSILFLPVIQVSGDSMEPTLSNGDIILLVKTKKFSRGQLCCLSWQNKLLLKRVIGLPGDVIEIDAEGNVRPCFGQCFLAADAVHLYSQRQEPCDRKSVPGQ